jgi:IMP dehydrogenase
VSSQESKKGYLPLVDENGCLRALTTRTDLKKNRDSPLSTKDSQGRLVVGAAVPASLSGQNGRKRPLDLDLERIRRLCQAEVDILLLDSLNGDNLRQLELLSFIKSTYPLVQVVAGNIVRPCQAIKLIEAGADALRVGMGSGSISTTQISRAVGRPQLSTIFSCARIGKEYGVPVIADGGLKNTGTITKALSLGASCVMMGSLLAGVEESPGEYFFQDGVQLKRYRSASASNYMEAVSSPKEKSAATSIAVSSAGVSGSVADKGPLGRYLPFLCQSIRHGLQDMGVNSIVKMHQQMIEGELRFELRSTSAQREGGVHDLHSFSQKLFA